MNVRRFAYASLILAVGAIAVPILFVIGIVAAIFLLPPFMLFGLLVYSVSQRRIRRVANITSCVVCGRNLGALSVQHAKEWVRDALQEPRAGRLLSVDAICQHCGKWYKFDFKQNGFAVIDGLPRARVCD